MALAYVGRAGSNTGNTRGAAVTVTTTAAIAAGDLIIVSVSGENVGDLSNLASITDTAGNTYTSAKFTVDGGQNTLAAVWYCANCAALSSGSTVTVTFNSQLLASGESWEIAVDDVSGAATASVTDGTNGHNSQVINATTTWDTNSITTTNADDLLWVAMGVNQGETAAVTNAQSTPSSGWTMQTAILGGTNSHNSLRTAYQIVSATGTYHGGGTATAFSNGVSAVIVAFKAAAGGGGALTGAATLGGTTGGVSASGTLAAVGSVTAGNLTGGIAASGTRGQSGAATLGSLTGGITASGALGATGSATLGDLTGGIVASVGGTAKTGAATLGGTTGGIIADGLRGQTGAATLGTLSGGITAAGALSAVGAATLGTLSGGVVASGALGAAGVVTLGNLTGGIEASVATIAVPGTVTLTDALAATVVLADALAATVTLRDALAASVTLSDAPAEAA